MYLVGTKKGAKRNNWLAIAKDYDAAVEVQQEIGPHAQVIRKIKKKGAK